MENIMHFCEDSKPAGLNNKIVTIAKFMKLDEMITSKVLAVFANSTLLLFATFIITGILCMQLKQDHTMNRYFIHGNI